MIRVVKTTEGTIVPDTTGRMNGRGASYVCSQRNVSKSNEKQRAGTFFEDGRIPKRFTNLERELNR